MLFKLFLVVLTITLTKLTNLLNFTSVFINFWSPLGKNTDKYLLNKKKYIYIYFFKSFNNNSNIDYIIDNLLIFVLIINYSIK